MQAADATYTSQTMSFQQRVRCGLKHRLICSAPGIILAPVFAFFASVSGGPLVFLHVVASLIVAGLGFLAPMILTEGWNKPFPPASHLALIGKRTQRVLTGSSAVCIGLPSLVYFAGHL